MLMPPSDSTSFDSGAGALTTIGSAPQILPTMLLMIIAMASEDEANPEGLVNYGFNETFKKPFDVALLAEHIRTIVEEKRAEIAHHPPQREERPERHSDPRPERQTQTEVSH